MQLHDPAGEFLRISEHYRRLSDSELLILSAQASQLTDLAQQALATEIFQRRLQPELEEKPSPPAPEPSPDVNNSPYDEERKLVELCTVWSLSDALQVQTLLDRAGIPFYMGVEKATGVDQVTSSFPSGVSVKIMQVGMPWARQAMIDYEPQNEPPPKPQQDADAPPVRCPKCYSTEVIFSRLVTAPTARDESSAIYEWTCDSCGHQWEDDGVAED
jgi:DNA-directed RNA polymerase subunit M/transcription elongation factor TFIIS